MSYTVGDGMVALALAGGIVGYYHVVHRSRQQRMELIHQERLAAMDKDIPLPELPLEPEKKVHEPDPRIMPVMGMVLFTLSLGAMIAMFLGLSGSAHSAWIAPLPLAFLGVGLMAYHVLSGRLGP